MKGCLNKAAFHVLIAFIKSMICFNACCIVLQTRKGRAFKIKPDYLPCTNNACPTY